MVSAIILPVFSVRSYALENWADDCYVASEGACLMDAGSGVILFGKNMDEAYYPASITKVLTALVTIENCDNLSEQVIFSYDAVHIEEENSTIIGASEGDRLSVLDCLYCLLFQSANEVANALAEHVGAKHPELKEEGMNDRQVFVKMMNLRAEEAGCRGSHFNNPSGLTDEQHYTTAYDMCCIMAAAIANDTFLDIESHTYWTHAPIRRYPDANDPWNTVYAKHMMIRRNSAQYYSGTIAGKTGYTMTAGNTLVTACRRGEMTLVSCVLNAHANHYNDTRRLMDFGFDNFSSLLVTDYDNTNSVLASDYQIAGVDMIESYTLGIDPDTRITLPKGGSFAEVRKSLDVYSGTGSATLGRMTYTYGDRTVGIADLKLMNIGSSSELLQAAEMDPILADALGVVFETAPAETNAENTASQAEAANGTAAAAAQASAAGSAQNNAAAPAQTPAVKQEVSGGMDAAQGGWRSLLRKIRAGRALKIAGLVIAGIAVLFAAVTGIGYIRESGQARRRAKRREERLLRTGDMTGTQQIKMDLEVQKRLRKTKKKKK